MSERDKWERILESEGLGEISLFDNTGKNRNVRFISTTSLDHPHNTLPSGHRSFNDDTNREDGDAAVYWNNRNFGKQTALADLHEAEYYRKLSIDVESLPPGWDRDELAFLRLWADIGVINEAARILQIDGRRAKEIVKKFREWVKDAN